MVTVMDSLTIFLVPLLQAFQPDRGYYVPSIEHEFLPLFTGGRQLQRIKYVEISVEISRQVPFGGLIWKIFNLTTRWVKVARVGRDSDRL
ncbi:hypothetical protein HD554DRAFT_1503976 [Boletus coccyginus]|nr:hypothetical protein HD554DRAFT_1503976 [Boletus coccyginus]